MARKENVKLAKYRDDFNRNEDAIDKAERRIIRYANALHKLRTRRTYLRRAVATELARA